MSTALSLALVIAAVVLLGSLRLWRQTAYSAARRAALIVLQALSALLLYLALLPPPLPGQAGTLQVLTATATAPQSQRQAADVVVALPEAQPIAAIEAVPDLATALRRHPGMQRLHILGAGLEPRDLDAAATLPLSLQPAAPMRGWVMLQPPPVTAPGARFSVVAGALGVAQGQAELLDPAGRRVDSAALDDNGQVRLSGSVRAPGQTLFTLRLLDQQRQPVESLPVPVRVEASAPARVWLLAAAPGPELKYLRRWASDAGLQLHTQMAIGGGLQLGDAPRPLDAATLAATDLLVLDERSLAGLAAAQRAALRDAVDRGLGVLVRITGTVADSSRQSLRDFGLVLQAGDARQPLKADRSPSDAGLRSARRGLRATALDNSGDDDRVPLLERGVDATGAQSVALLHDNDGRPLGRWNAYGQGRVGVLPLGDSFHWVLAGHGELHGELWSQVFATLARARSAAPAARLPALAWAGERMALCGLQADASVIAPDGRRSTPLLDPASTDGACAAYWPQQPGWYQLQQAAQRTAFHVLGDDDAVTMRRYRQYQATAQLAAAAHGASAGAAVPPRPGRRWPWLLGFLASASALWWLERHRGRRPATAD